MLLFYVKILENKVQLDLDFQLIHSIFLENIVISRFTVNSRPIFNSPFNEQLQIFLNQDLLLNRESTVHYNCHFGGDTLYAHPLLYFLWWIMKFKYKYLLQFIKFYWIFCLKIIFFFLKNVFINIIIFFRCQKLEKTKNPNILPEEKNVQDLRLPSIIAQAKKQCCQIYTKLLLNSLYVHL